MNMEDKILQVPVEDIIPNRFQPRLSFDEQALNELAASIKQHGIIQPLVLRKLGDKYEIVAGERRYKAAQIASLTSVPAVISNIDDSKSAEVALIENIQRKNLTSIEEARSYRNILDRGVMTQEQLAEKLGVSQSTVANKLRLLNLANEVQDALLNEKISERHARALLSLKEHDEQVKWLNKIINDRLTVRQLDIELKKANNSTPDEEIIPLVNDLTPNIDDIKNNALDINPVQGLHNIENMLKPSMPGEKVYESSNPSNIEVLDLDTDNSTDEAAGGVVEEKNPNKFFNFLEDEVANMNEDNSIDDIFTSVPSFVQENQNIQDNINTNVVTEPTMVQQPNVTNINPQNDMIQNQIEPQIQPVDQLNVPTDTEVFNTQSVIDATLNTNEQPLNNQIINQPVMEQSIIQPNINDQIIEQPIVQQVNEQPEISNNIDLNNNNNIFFNNMEENNIQPEIADQISNTVIDINDIPMEENINAEQKKSFFFNQNINDDNNIIQEQPMNEAAPISLNQNNIIEGIPNNSILNQNNNMIPQADTINIQANTNNANADFFNFNDNSFENSNSINNNNAIEEVKVAQNTTMFDPMSMINTLEPGYNEKVKEENGTDLKTAIDILRKTKEDLELRGFVVNLEEADLGNSYNVSFTIAEAIDGSEEENNVL